MWEVIGTVLVQLLKWSFEYKSKKKLSDDQFLAHLKAHQERKLKIAQSTLDFEDQIKEISKKQD